MRTGNRVCPALQRHRTGNFDIPRIIPGTSQLHIVKQGDHCRLPVANRFKGLFNIIKFLCFSIFLHPGNRVADRLFRNRDGNLRQLCALSQFQIIFRCPAAGFQRHCFRQYRCVDIPIADCRLIGRKFRRAALFRVNLPCNPCQCDILCLSLRSLLLRRMDGHRREHTIKQRRQNAAFRLLLCRGFRLCRRSRLQDCSGFRLCLGSFCLLHGGFRHRIRLAGCNGFRLCLGSFCLLHDGFCFRHRFRLCFGSLCLLHGGFRHRIRLAGCSGLRL